MLWLFVGATITKFLLLLLLLSEESAIHSTLGMLLLDEKAYKALAENSKVLYLLQWLQNLPKVIKDTERVSQNSVLQLEAL